jgi:hypothetical protein
MRVVPHVMTKPADWNFQISIEYEWCQLHASKIESGHFLG